LSSQKEKVVTAFSFFSFFFFLFSFFFFLFPFLKEVKKLSRLGTKGEDILVSQYCELYWQNNELQIIGTVYSMKESDRLIEIMGKIEEVLGYVPAC
jgi:hypothetical protein